MIPAYVDYTALACTLAGTATKQIGVGVVDSDGAARALACGAIESNADLRLAGVAENVRCACDLIRHTPPEVLLLELELPDGSGLEVIRFARSHAPAVKILVVTRFTEERHVLESIEAGAAGYILKGTSGDDVRRSILDVHAGRSPISPLVAGHLLKQFRRLALIVGTGQADKAVLSARELAVLQLVAKGLSVREAAQVLALSSLTVSTHAKNIYRKLAVNSRSEAVYEARRLGLLVL